MDLNSRAQQVFEFGQAVDSPPLYFVTIVDFNQKPIKVGYQDYEVTVQQIFNNYLQVTSCRGFMLNPCFKVNQGPTLGEPAIETNKLASYGFSFDTPCFRVCDEDKERLQKQRTSAISRFNFASNNQNTIPVKIQVQNFEDVFKINLNESLKTLKQRLIKSFEILKNQSPINLHLIKDGLFIIDDSAQMKSYGITKNMKLRVIIMKKHGCFRKTTRVKKSQIEDVAIEKLKIGDEVLSYNQKNKQFEVDKITSIYQTNVDYTTVIQLSNGAKIQTTSNHLFLCQDHIYRSVEGDKSRGSHLSIGTKLKLFKNTAEIISIQNKNLLQPQKFYHLSIENNHNFIVNEAIVHNLFINLIIPTGASEKVNLEVNQPFLKIKEYVEQNYQIQKHNQRLFFAGKELLDQQTMTDRNVPKQSNIYLRFKPSEQFNYLHPSTPVLTYRGQQIAISKIKQGQGIVSWDVANRAPSKAGDIVLDIDKREIKEVITIRLDTFEQQITTSADCYLELENGEAMNVKDLCYLYGHDEWPLLKKIDGTIYKIKQIVHEILPAPQQFVKLILSTSENYIGKNLIIHNVVINIIVIKNKKRYQKFSIGAKSTDKIINLKNQVSRRSGIPVNNLQLTFNNQLLDNDAQIGIYNIRIENVITANSIQKVSKSSLLISKFKQPSKVNTINLQLSQDKKIQIDYEQYKDKTVEEIMSEMIPSYDSSFFFIFAKLIIHPHQKLNKIQSSPQFGDTTIIVVKNQKWAFIQNMNIQGDQVKNQSFIWMPQEEINIGNSSSRIKVFKQDLLSQLFAAAHERIQADNSLKPLFKTQKFYLPFLYYSSRKYNDKIYRYIKKFEKYKNELYDNTSVFSIIKDLYLNMNMLPSYIDKCYFGMKNFKFSKFYKPKHTFYWHSFAIAYKQEGNLQDELRNQNGTLFIINSLNGKQMHQFSVDPSKKQILFAPFTYFMVERIEKGQGFDIVEISQISSPITFQKNIVLWVDDEPKNNLKIIQQILRPNNIEILQVTSTDLAEKWVKQFGWLLNWKGQQFKLISDMRRIENGVNKAEAGVDLLVKLYKEHGISAQTLIYCGDQQNAENNVKARNIPRQKYFSITTKEPDVKKFCIFKNV